MARSAPRREGGVAPPGKPGAGAARHERDAVGPRTSARPRHDLVARERQHDELRERHARACSRRTRTRCRSARPASDAVVADDRAQRAAKALVALTPRNATTIVPAAHVRAGGGRGGDDHGGGGRRGVEARARTRRDPTSRRRPRSRRWHRRCRAAGAPSTLGARRALPRSGVPSRAPAADRAAGGARARRSCAGSRRRRRRALRSSPPCTRGRRPLLRRGLPARADRFVLGAERFAAGRMRDALAALRGALSTARRRRTRSHARSIGSSLPIARTPPDGVLFTGYYLPTLAAHATRDAALPVSGARPPARSRDGLRPPSSTRPVVPPKSPAASRGNGLRRYYTRAKIQAGAVPRRAGAARGSTIRSRSSSCTCRAPAC